MIETRSILDIMQEKYTEMTKKQRILANYLVNSYQSAAFMNTKEIAKKANVSESTLLRLVDLLGFNKFSDFQDALQSLVRNKMSTLEMYKSQNGADQKKKPLDYIADMEIFMIKNMTMNIDETSFNMATELLEASQYVYIVGLGADDIYSRYLFRFLSILRRNVIMIAHPTDPTIYNLLEEEHFFSSTAVIFHFPRYYKATSDICSYFASRKARLVVVTDNILAPLTPKADVLIQVPTQYTTVIDPVAAGLVLIHALLTAVIMRNPDVYRKRLQRFYDLSEDLNNVIKRKVVLPFNIEGIS
ncbi:MAG: MurR/RpiR family transcriptional regulator [Synergistaceae bacterium]|nr:MurR/RpiR family transcriptional regulator [Synergistaceae bacterium]